VIVSRLARRSQALLAAALLTASIPVVVSSPAAAADPCPAPATSCVVVNIVSTVNGRETVDNSYTVTPDQVAGWADLQDPAYYTRKTPGAKEVRGPVVPQGLSLHHLLESVDPDDAGLGSAVTFSETPNAAHVPAVLSDADLADPSGNDYPFDDNLPPAVHVTEDGIGYVRPLRGSRDDVNASDIFTVSGALVLTFHTTGKLLEPAVKASAGTDVKTKQKNTFSVTFANAPGTRIISTRWDFGDGRTADAEKATRSYATKGTYPVVATVRGANGSYGRTPALEVKVAKPPTAPSSGTGGGNGGGTGGGGTGGGFGGGGVGGGYVPPFDPGVGSLPGAVPDEGSPLDDQSGPVDDGLQQVEGYVLAGAEIAPGGTVERIPGTRDTPETAAATQASRRREITTWAVAAVAVVLLLGAGAASETRWIRTHLRYLRRRA
jgi:hypothetical protein